ncbi:hypothetical protein [Suttonella indologenes]|uniref:Uncharacterized protein n=1 Tax=Suttonella indologenes TaxID=13276 RepID=A0A380N2L6_9GAMM|nr:hypothetical protein [Suttonella indologenes]SUO98161.1 Uncharacterised protein [Suttonella indologenes]
MPLSKHSIITPLVSQKKLQRLPLGMYRAQHGETGETGETDIRRRNVMLNSKYKTYIAC